MSKETTKEMERRITKMVAEQMFEEYKEKFDASKHEPLDYAGYVGQLEGIIQEVLKVL